MNKEQFIEVYPQISKGAIEGYMKAMKEQDMSRIHGYSTLIITESECSNSIELYILTHNLESLLDEYGIDYRYKENKHKDVQTRLNLPKT